MNCLVTGASSGLGKFLAGEFKATAWDRKSAGHTVFDRSFNLIIHCAFSKPETTKPGADLELLSEVLKIPHKKFVFISSSDVYPKNSSVHTENETLNEQNAVTDYAMAKIKCEELVVKSCADCLIIRPTSLIGPDIINRNLKILINDDKPVLSLSENSSWNFVTYSEVAELITAFTDNKISGIVNLARTKAVTVKEVAGLLRRLPVFGEHTYITPVIDNTRARSLIPSLNETSLDFIKRRLNNV